MSYNSTHTGAQIDAAINAVANKQDKLVSGTNIKTVNNKSILGAGNLSMDDLIDLSIGTRNYVQNSISYPETVISGTTAIFGLEEPLKNSTTYTLSFTFELHTPSTATFTIQCIGSDGTTIKTLTEKPSYNSEKGRFEVTFVFTGENSNTTAFYNIAIVAHLAGGSSTSPTTGSLSLVKLEKSNIASDWTHSYTDILNYISDKTGYLKSSLFLDTDHLSLSNRFHNMKVNIYDDRIEILKSDNLIMTIK